MIRRSAAAPASGTQVITNGPFGTPSNGFTGWVGFSFSIAADQTIVGLSRWALTSNTQTHTVKLWTNGGTELASASVDVSAVDEEWVTVPITPVVISAGTYRIASAESNGGDDWYSQNENYILETGFTKVNSIFGTGAYADTDNSATLIYVPVGFEFA